MDSFPYNGDCVKLVSDLKIKIFADGADKAQILRSKANPLIKGFTTNPTLMRAAGVTDYEGGDADAQRNEQLVGQEVALAAETDPRAGHQRPGE